MVDASPSNLHLWQAPLWIYFLSPDPSKLRFFVALRDSSERLFSHWNMAYRRGFLKTKFDEFVAQSTAAFDSCLEREMGAHAAWNATKAKYPIPGTGVAMSAGPLGHVEALMKVPFSIFHEGYRECVTYYGNYRFASSFYNLGLRSYLRLFDRSQFSIVGYQGMKGGKSVREKLEFVADVAGFALNPELVAAVEGVDEGRVESYEELQGYAYQKSIENSLKRGVALDAE